MTLHVVFVVAGVTYALPADLVRQMESFSEATPVPGAPNHVMGVVAVRGRVVPVIDLRLRFGSSAGENTPDTRIIVVETGSRVVALRVDSAREVLSLDPAQRQAAPDLVCERSAGLVNGMHAQGSRLLLLLDLAKVLGEENHDHQSLARLDDEAHHRPALPG